MPIHGSGVALLIDRLSDLNFYDEFNRSGEDTDIWTSGGDAGGFQPAAVIGNPTSWVIQTGNVIDNDRFINGSACIKNKFFTPADEGYTTVTWETRFYLDSVADISALWGLITSPVDNYAEPLIHSATFFADPAITNTFRVRSYAAAEEETDTLIALDTDFHKFKIVWTTTSVLFYIDDVLVATHATQVPNLQAYTEFLIRTEAAAIKRIYLDYVYVEVT